MSLFNCDPRCNCAAASVVVSAVVGVLTAFLQITALVLVTPVFLWVLFGIAVVYLGVLAVTSALVRRAEPCVCACASLNVLLAGLLGTIALSVVLLAFGITATSVVSAILAGLLLFFFTLTLTGTACYVRCISNCD